MHAGHCKVKEEEHLGLLCHIRRQRLFVKSVRVRVDELRDIKAGARNMMLLPLLVVLNVLDTKKGHSEERGKH